VRATALRRGAVAATLLCAGALAGGPVPAASALFTDSQPVVSAVTSRNSLGIAQVAGATAGCISNDGTSGNCQTGTAIHQPANFVMSSDSAYAYGALYLGNAVGVFTRDSSTGALSRTQCISNSNLTGCTTGKAVGEAWGVAISSDDKFVYYASYTSDAIAVFQRNPTDGTLSQLGGTSACVSKTVSGCDSSYNGLNGADGIAVYGNNVYVTGYDDNSLTAYTRDPTTGAITGQIGCWTNGTITGCTTIHNLGGAVEARVSPDGKSVYVVGYTDNAIAEFQRNSAGTLTVPSGTAACVNTAGANGCATDANIAGPYDLAVSPDNTSVYVAGYTNGTLNAFSRDTGTGALTRLTGTAGCIANSATANCVTGSAMSNAEGVAVSPDSQDVYLVSHNSSTLEAFRRDTSTGALTQLPGAKGCIANSSTTGCVTGKGLSSPIRVMVSPDGKDLYASGGYVQGATTYGFIASFNRSR